MNTVALGDVCQVTTGQSAPQDADAFGSIGVPFVRAGSLERLCAGDGEDSLERIPPDKAAKYRLKVYPADTVIFPKSGMSAKVGRVYRLRRECHLVSHLAAVLPSDKVSAAYLHRWFEYSPPSNLIENDAYPSIKTSTLQDIQLRLPPQPEQRRIAAILDKADALRAQRREAIAKLDQLLQSVFLDMFGDTRAESISVADLSASEKAIRTGPFGSQLLHSEFVESGVAVLGIDNAVTNTFVWAKPRFVTEKKYAALSRYKVFPGDVLITIMGTCGRCAVVPEDIPAAINTKHLCCITLDRDRCDPEFLHSYFLMHPQARSYLESRAKGAIMSGLNMGVIKDLPVALPPIEKQQHFVSIKMSLQQQKERLVDHLNHSDSLFASLQHRAFTGTL